MPESIVKQIEVNENSVLELEHSIDRLERRLRLFDITDEEREKLEDELKQSQEQLAQIRKDIRSLRYENFRTSVISAVVVLIIFGIYAAFTMDS